MSDLIVQKYGGTSVGSLDRIEKVAAHIGATWASGARLVVVVSAMGSYTDDLLQTAYTLHPTPPKRELDMLITTGERISMALLSIALAKRQIPCISLTGSQSGILTDQNHGNARIRKILGDRIRQGLADKRVVIVAGFQGVNPETKDITSLGRGGSDLTAIALAVSLSAQACQIYTDVEGVLTTDPRFVANARLLNHISWPEMTELAWAGAGVLHHRGAYVAGRYQLPVEVRSSLTPEKSGTLIQGMRRMEEAQLTALTHKKNQSLLRLICTNTQAAAQLTSLCLGWLWQHDESPGLLHSVSMADGRVEILALFHERFAQPLLEYLASEAKGGRAPSSKTGACRDHMGMITIVGQGFRQSPELISSIYSECAGAELVYTETRDQGVSLVLAQDAVPPLLTALHQRFFPSPDAP